MSRMRAILGPTYYEPRTAWGPWGAVIALLVVYNLAGFAQGFGWGVFVREMIQVQPAPDGSLAPSMAAVVIVLLLLPSLVIIGATLWLAPRGGLRAAEVLALRRPQGGGKVFLVIAAVASIDLAIGFGVTAIALANDAAAAQKLTATWAIGGRPLQILTVCVVAPIAEEFAFRGFLLPAFAKTRLGFWGAVLVTNALFTAAHYRYHVAPLLFIPVFIWGVVWAWALGLAGSLWVPIALHIIFNLIVNSLAFAYFS